MPHSTYEMFIPVFLWLCEYEYAMWSEVLFSCWGFSQFTVIRMRAVWSKRPVLILGGIGLLFYMGIYLKRGYERVVGTGKEVDSPHMSRIFSDLKMSLNNLSE